MFIEAEKQQSTNKPTATPKCFGLALRNQGKPPLPRDGFASAKRCEAGWSVRQWSFAAPPTRDAQLPAVQESSVIIMLTMEEALKQSTAPLRFATGEIVT